MENTITFIIHVRTAIERERHMLQQISGKNLSIQFILDGDRDQLNAKILDKYFSGEMRQISNGTSCAFKHILSYENMLEKNIEQALILEDDIELDVHFEDFLGKIYDEIDRNNISNYLISLEDSNLKYVKGSERKPDQFLYPKKMGRMAGAYLIDLKAARNMLHEIDQNKCTLPIDWFHNLCSKKNILNIWWAHPAIACQGSLSGSIKSLIDDKPANFIKRLSFKIQRVYKKLVYYLR